MEKGIKRLNEVCTPYLWINPRICRACWKCLYVCPRQVIGKVGFLWHKHIVIRDGDSCIGCKKCFSVCRYNVFTEI